MTRRVSWLTAMVLLVTAALPAPAASEPAAGSPSGDLAGAKKFMILSGGTGKPGIPYRTEFVFTAQEWEVVCRPLKAQLASPMLERLAIAQSLLIFDRMLAWKTVAARQEVDKGSWIANHFHAKGQMNCVNVTSNTYAVLRALQGLIHHHTLPVNDIGEERGDDLKSVFKPGSYDYDYGAIGHDVVKIASNTIGGTSDLHHVASLWEGTNMTKVASVPAEKVWIYDRWPFDLGDGRILLQPLGEFKQKKDGEGPLGREIHLSTLFEGEKLVGPRPGATGIYEKITGSDTDTSSNW